MGWTRPIQWRTFAGVRTRVLEADGRGPTVILLHGYSDTVESWRGVLDLLERRGCRAVAVDLPGFGKADPLREGPLVEQLIEFVTEVIQAHSDGGPPILVGNSLGGFAALHGAATEPVSGVVALSPAGYGYTRLLGVGARMSGALSRPINAGLVPPAVARLVASRLVSRAMVYRQRGVRSALLSYAGQFQTREDIRRVVGSSSRVAQEAVLIPPPVLQIDAPVFVVVGERDRLVPHTAAAPLAKMFPHGTYEVWPDVGHCPHIEVPELTGMKIVTFVRQVSI